MSKASRKIKKSGEKKQPKKQLSQYEKAARSAFVCGIIGVASAGILPPLGIATIIASCVLKSKPLGEDYEFMRKKALPAGIIALVMFGLDIGIYYLFKFKATH